ncbi:MAG: T9SS type A sorting domain-containing protein [Flavobacteriales bacterium]
MKHARYNYYFTLILVGLFSHMTQAQTGVLDPTFGINGMASIALDSNGCTVRAMALQSDGRIVLAGRLYTSLGSDIYLISYMTDGSLDPSFGDSGQVRADLGSVYDECTSVAILPDGKILVAGYTQDSLPTTIALARFTPDGSLDNSFGNGGVSNAYQFPYSSARDMQIQSDGRIVLAGEQGWQKAIFRFLPDGAPDSSFHADGMADFQPVDQFSVLQSIAIQEDGKFVATGFGGAPGNYNIVLARLLPDGDLDQTFGSSGLTNLAISPGDDVAESVAIQSDGKIIVVGSKSYYPDYDMFSARFLEGGLLDNTFGDGGLRTISTGIFTDHAYDVVLQPDGKILLAGETQSNGTTSATLVRLLTNGQLDVDFGQNGTVIQNVFGPHMDRSIAIDLLPDGKILIAGKVDGVQPTVARYLSGLYNSVGENYTSNMSLSVYPNPVRDLTYFEFNLDEAEPVTVEIQDMEGRIVKSFLDQVIYAAGNQCLQMDMRGMATGQYNVVIRTARNHALARMVKW